MPEYSWICSLSTTYQTLQRYQGSENSFCKSKTRVDEDIATESSQVDGAEKAEIKQEVPDGEAGAETAAKVVTAESARWRRTRVVEDIPTVVYFNLSTEYDFRILDLVKK
jgi:hypothetical protein